MAVANPYNFPSVNPQAITGDPGRAQNQDGIPSVLLTGRLGDQLGSEVRGKYGTMGSRGHVYRAAASTAAIAIPVNTTTNGSTFCLVNPAGSGVVVELVRFKLDFLHTNAAPATANVIGFSIVPPTNALSAVTKIADAITAGGGPVNQIGPSGQGYVASAITFASALTVAANWHYPMFSFPASWVPTVGGYPVPLEAKFDGELMLTPGYALTLTASTAWGSNTVVPALSWLEHLL